MSLQSADWIQELSYADDIVILQPDSASCQDLLDRISEKAEMLGLKIKLAKTKVIYFHLNQQPNLTVYGETIKVTEFFTYLGSGISSRHTSAKDEISAHVRKASITFNQLKHRIFKRQDLSLGLKMKVFHASVLSVLLYGSETWTMTKVDLMTLEIFQMYALHLILGVSRLQRLRNTDNQEICCCQPTIDNAIRLRRLRWLGRVACMLARHLCGSIWRNPKPSSWLHTHNASKCTWDSTIQKDLSFLKSSYGSVNWHNNSTSIFFFFLLYIYFFYYTFNIHSIFFIIHFFIILLLLYKIWHPIRFNGEELCGGRPQRTSRDVKLSCLKLQVASSC